MEASTEDHVSFTALSYAWGSDLDTKTIICSGTRYLRVRSNLFHSLWYIRDPVKALTLWVDAI